METSSTMALVNNVMELVLETSSTMELVNNVMELVNNFLELVNNVRPVGLRRRQCGAELLLLGAPLLVHSAQLTLPLPPPPTHFATAPSIGSCGARAACSLRVLVVVGTGKILLSARARSRWAPTAAAH